MNVTEALSTRISCRAFTPDPVDEATVRRILATATRSPSGGNLQPWHVSVLTGPALAALLGDVAEEMKTRPMGGPPAYPVYPEKLKSPYRDRRFKVGEDMYATLGIPREDKPGRLTQFANNYRMFGAPVGLFIWIDRQMGPPQWADAGMFVLSLMLAAREEGLHSCAQEAWAMWEPELRRHMEAPEERMIYCGVALGHMDETAPINTLRADRAPVDEIAEFRGF